MEENNKQWLPHLTGKIVSEIEGNFLDSYAVALEGWRRGLKLKWHVKGSEKFKEMEVWSVDRPGQLFSLSSKEKTHYFFRSRGDDVSNEAVQVGRSKERTNAVLRDAGVPVPEGRNFGKESSDDELIQYAETLGFPIVVKPTDGSFGRGVVSNIRSSGELADALEHVRRTLGFMEVIIEKYIPGRDYRLYVVGNEVVAAMHRLPPNVTGDGESTIRKLIRKKNALRKENPRLISCPIGTDQETRNYLDRSGYTLKTIPAEGETVFLNDKANISIGGDPIDAFDELSPQVKETAVKAMKAVSGLTHGAVDMIIGTDDEEAGHVIELNPTAQLGGLLYPVKGQARDVPAAIIDHYFPETRGLDIERAKIYFDFHDLLDPLQARDAVITTVTPSLEGKLHAKKYTVTGDVQNIGYHRGLRKQAFERGLHGYVMNMDDAIEVVVGGTDLEMVDDFEHGLWEDEERAKIFEVIKEEYDGPIKVGFEIKTDLKTQLRELKALKKELDMTEYERKKAEAENRKFHRSTSWKVATPVRLAGGIIKRIRKR
ncbi:acylphosphatase [Salinicoccus roseus]|uniref:acylphosphatase n=1 Tax=Salinicoccus roseus TaxID=45670 RepID=UPI001EF4DD1F|nr:acylphosphatase [Salinicoccus roseus]MCG7333027.1 acylphosphatase [Salinicoccus roseus]